MTPEQQQLVAKHLAALTGSGAIASPKDSIFNMSDLDDGSAPTGAQPAISSTGSQRQRASTTLPSAPSAPSVPPLPPVSSPSALSAAASRPAPARPVDQRWGQSLDTDEDDEDEECVDEDNGHSRTHALEEQQPAEDKKRCGCLSLNGVADAQGEEQDGDLDDEEDDQEDERLGVHSDDVSEAEAAIPLPYTRLNNFCNEFWSQIDKASSLMLQNSSST